MIGSTAIKLFVISAKKLFLNVQAVRLRMIGKHIVKLAIKAIFGIKPNAFNVVMKLLIA